MTRFIAVSPPGLESLLSRELSDLRLIKPAAYLKPSARSEEVAFDGGEEALYRACLWLRTAERVLVPLGRFPAASFAELERGAAALRWDERLPAGKPLLIRADCRRSKLYHEKGVAERLARAAGRPLAGEEEGAQLVYATVEGDVCSVDLDACGAPLHKRGYRLATAKAPLRETVAAALVLASGWDAASPLLDPFCGSGTIAIEAALLAARLAPGRARAFAFEEWRGFDAALWKRLLAEAAAGRARALPPILASDRDAGAIDAARENARRAGVEAALALSCRAVSAVEPPPLPGWLVTNPPYGLRVKGGDARDALAQLGKLAQARCPGWKAALVLPPGPLAGAAGLGLRETLSTKNGGVSVRFYRNF